MKRFLLLITCLAMYSTQSMQKPKTPSMRVSLRELLVATAAVIAVREVVGFGARIVRNRWNRPQQAPISTIEDYTTREPDAVPAAVSPLVLLRTETPAIVKLAAQADSADAKIQSASTTRNAATQTDQTQETAAAAPAVAPVNVATETPQAPDTQAAAPAVAPVNAATETPQASDTQAAASAAAIERLRREEQEIARLIASAEASERCNRLVTRGAGVAALAYAVLYFIASQVPPLHLT